jgi:hypothetical protein
VCSITVLLFLAQKTSDGLTSEPSTVTTQHGFMKLKNMGGGGGRLQCHKQEQLVDQENHKTEDTWDEFRTRNYFVGLIP